MNKVISTLHWLPNYYGSKLKRLLSSRPKSNNPRHVYFCICDHFEPYWNGADRNTARRRIQRWLDHYPKIAENYTDSFGDKLKYSFFYPEEEYREEDLNALAGLCHAGYGEVEIHLHHDNDTADNFRRTLVDYKNRLHEKHGLLATDKKTGEIIYGFIHGNWALNNSRPDGRWCGVNDETSILLETGCYADFTMPSAPCPTQTKKVNSIYYSVGSCTPKSHDRGVDLKVGGKSEGLLMVQGPLGLNWKKRKLGLLPRIENGGLLGNNPPSAERMKLWIDTGICVEGAPDHIFVKLYTHGTQERVMEMLFDQNGFASFFKAVQQLKEMDTQVHFHSASEFVDSIKKVAEAR